ATPRCLFDAPMRIDRVRRDGTPAKAAASVSRIPKDTDDVRTGTEKPDDPPDAHGARAGRPVDPDLRGRGPLQSLARASPPGLRHARVDPGADGGPGQ